MTRPMTRLGACGAPGRVGAGRGVAAGPAPAPACAPAPGNGTASSTASRQAAPRAQCAHRWSARDETARHAQACTGTRALQVELAEVFRTQVLEIRLELIGREFFGAAGVRVRRGQL